MQSFLQMMAACPSQISIFAFPPKSKYSIEISKSKIESRSLFLVVYSDQRFKPRMQDAYQNLTEASPILQVFKSVCFPDFGTYHSRKTGAWFSPEKSKSSRWGWWNTIQEWFTSIINSFWLVWGDEGIFLLLLRAYTWASGWPQTTSVLASVHVSSLYVICFCCL